MSALAFKTLPSAEIRNVLFATDFSVESMHALPYVAGIARKLGSSVYVCHIVAPNPLVASAPEVAPTLYAGLREQAEAELATIVASAALQDLGAKPIVRSGAIEDELCDVVTDQKIDLIVAGTHGRTGMRKMLLGSVVEEICRVASCPVLTVGPALAPKKEIQLNRIVFPTDLSADSKRILPVLRSIAESYEAEITVLHVLPEELASNVDAAKLAEPIRRTMIHMCEAELPGVKVEVLIGFGEAVETILRTARAKKADLIAMGLHNAFLPGIHLRSSAAYRIMAGAHCPVLTSR
jgi:nucleotide-binding universal stress UspA family protein